MVFSSLLFIFLYLAAVLLIYYILPRRFRNPFLFVANLVFYGYGEPVFILLMLFSTAVNYGYGLLINRYRDRKRLAKVLLVTSIVINLGLLGFFKYAGFVTETVNAIFPAAALAVPLIPLPIGISFYTFQTMSYTIDVYRNDSPVQRNFISFGTYVALFPQLIAGPIVRYVDVADQLDNRRENWAQFNRGVKIFLVGLAKKVLIANQMGSLWSTLKATGAENGLIGSWVGIFAFALQIYFDFSGYSDMARGLGNMFGFEFLKNFDYPYISKSITEFWRRWHISLGTWFREYVYIPLGGNRKGKPRLLLNLLIVWFLTGLWHGASWNFVLWGLYFGLLLIFEKFFLLKVLERLPAFFSHLYALFFIVLGWVLFDFTDLSAMGSYLHGMFSLRSGWISTEALPLVLSYLPLFAVAIFACLPLGKRFYYRIQNARWCWAAELGVCTAVLFLCTASLVRQTYNPFLYFRF